jgi:hypothetical protein
MESKKSQCIVQDKVWNKQTISLFVVYCLTFADNELYANALENVLPNGKYDNSQYNGGRSANMFRILQIRKLADY